MKTTLTASSVSDLLRECLFKEGESQVNPVIAEGVLRKFGFHPGRIAENADKIRALLADLPDDFQADKGGGMSFLNACMTKDGDQWGEHINIDELVCLGVAIGAVKFGFPRDMWSILPGGMPYLCVDTRQPA